MLSVFSFRLRVLAGGEDLVDVEMVVPVHVHTHAHAHTYTHERSTAVHVLVWEELG